jgi:hypothetical protein
LSQRNDFTRVNTSRLPQQQAGPEVRPLKIIDRGRVRAAFAVAIGADVLQIALFPLFAEGIISPLDISVDVLVCLVLTRLVGWHYAFLPSFILEMVPMADLIPSWTLAVLVATRRQMTTVAGGKSEGAVQAEPEGRRPSASRVIDV